MPYLIKMNFTFGIVTGGNNDASIAESIASIREQKIPEYQIIIVGQTNLSGYDIMVVPFDETIKRGWITKKKNLITSFAKYDTIVYMHDYVKLCPGWYAGFLEFGSDFETCVTRIHNKDNRRFRDSVLFVHQLPRPFQIRALFPYTYTPSMHINRLMYISGAYYIMKKKTAEAFPLNEDLIWGAGEDVDLCFRLTDANIRLHCNPHSSVIFMKQKEQIEWECEMTAEDLQKLESYTDDQLEEFAVKQRAFVKAWIYRQIGVHI
jgi:hypothetical protein